MVKGTTFISYARPDSVFALKLAKDLQTTAATIWLDQLNIEAGENWDNAVQKALAGCGIFVVILTPAAVASENVLDEVAYALDNKKQVLPILQQACDRPFRLSRKQYIDFTGDYDTGLKQLFKALKVSPVAKAPVKKTAKAKIKSESGAITVTTAQTDVPDARKPKHTFRSSPATLSGDDVKKMLKKYDFYSTAEYGFSKAWSNPGGKGIVNDFQRKGQVIFDATTGLTWQQSGSPASMTFEKTQAYIEALNKKEFAGYSDWRLPTLEEAMSLMAPEQSEDGLFIDPVFDKSQYWIWTADRYSASASWLVNFSYGYCYNYVTTSFYVRAVR